MADAPGSTPPTAFLVTSDRLGADPELGALLMQGFLNALAQAEARPARMVFLNTGVRLTTRGSAVLGALRELEARGVEILSCGTCLQYLDRKADLEVGSVTTMHDTVDALTGAWRVVTVS